MSIQRSGVGVIAHKACIHAVSAENAADSQVACLNYIHCMFRLAEGLQ